MSLPTQDQSREKLAFALSQGQFALTMAARSKAIEASYFDSLMLSFEQRVFNAEAVITQLPPLIDHVQKQVKASPDATDNVYILDAHKRPVDLDLELAQKLLEAAISLHQMATAKFLVQCNDLRTKRTVKPLVTL